MPYLPRESVTCTNRTVNLFDNGKNSATKCGIMFPKNRVSAFSGWPLKGLVKGKIFDSLARPLPKQLGELEYLIYPRKIIIVDFCEFLIASVASTTPIDLNEPYGDCHQMLLSADFQATSSHRGVVYIQCDGTGLLRLDTFVMPRCPASAAPCSHRM